MKTGGGLSPELKLTRARVQLLLKQPFFATLCLRMNLVPAPVPAMATNGKVIYYNPKFVDGLAPEELEGVVAHEVLHCALAHHCRRGSRDPRVWNQAADFAINPIVLKNELALPADALIRPEYEGLSAEEIYARLKEDGDGNGASTSDPANAGGSASSPQTGDAGAGSSSQKQDPQDAGANQTPESASEDGAQASGLMENRPGGFGEVLDATDDQGNPASEAERERQAHDWSIAAEQAMRAAKACGRNAANMERPLNEARESKRDWRSVLRDFVAATVPSDYRWCPPNRRFIASGLYLPSVHREGVGRIVIGVDTSGSIGQEELKQFAGEISAIADQAQPDAIHVVYCDAAIQSTEEFAPSEPIHLEPKGGGGTEFGPVFDWVEENNINPACLIYLTDLCCTSFPVVPPDYPVLWVTDSRSTAPFGETLKIEPY